MIQAMYEPHTLEGRMLPFIFFTRETSKLPVYHNWHSDVEFIYCISGEAKMFCDGETYELKPGDLFVVNPYKPHAMYVNSLMKYQCLIVGEQFCKENGIPIENLYFQEYIRDGKMEDNFRKVAEVYRAAYTDRKMQPVSREPYGTEAFRKELAENHTKTGDVARIRYEVLGFLIALCDHYVLDHQNDRKDTPAVKRVMEATIYIRRNLADTITLDELADHVGICKSHFSREFKKVTNMTIVEYINFLRCKEAKRLIMAGNSVSEAAGNAGFRNMSYFTKTYKRYMGEYPSRAGTSE